MAHGNKQRKGKNGLGLYAGGSTKVISEAKSGSPKFARGGKTCAMDGEKSHKRMDKFARGGKVNMSSAGGGSADKSPFSSAKR